MNIICFISGFAAGVLFIFILGAVLTFNDHRGKSDDLDY